MSRMAPLSRANDFIAVHSLTNARFPSCDYLPPREPKWDASPLLMHRERGRANDTHGNFEHLQVFLSDGGPAGDSKCALWLWCSWPSERHWLRGRRELRPTIRVTRSACRLMVVKEAISIAPIRRWGNATPPRQAARANASSIPSSRIHNRRAPAGVLSDEDNPACVRRRASLVWSRWILAANFRISSYLCSDSVGVVCVGARFER